MNNYKEPGNTLRLVAPYARDSGQGALFGDFLFGVAVHDVDQDESGEFMTEGVFELTKESGATWSVGEYIYWDDSAKHCTVTNSDGPLIGICVADAAELAVVGTVKLCLCLDLS